MPRVTALMPLFNGAEYIRESLESVQNQTYTDWEFIVVNDFGSDDGCADVVHQYSEKDPRIILVQLDTRLGLAASLNVGLDMARGEYIARVDVDDPSEPERFAKQVMYLDEHPEITLCSCYCKSITVNGSNQELVPTDPEELKAAMLFQNEIRHSGTMLRKSFFDSHNLRYDPNYIVEDYELWTRALMEGALLANLPEVLVTHRWGFGNVSISKGPQLEEESRTISKRILKWLGVDTDNCPPELLSGWRARPSKFAKANTMLVLQRGYELLNRIISANDDIGYCNPFAMRKIMLKRWDWIRQSCGFIFTEREYGQFDDITVTPIVTIVLPTYNSASDVSRAIDSAEDQTFTDWEMLVVNDCGSNDGTAEIVAMYSLRDSRIRMIQAEERLGLAESLNLGMKVARGEYIARMDADDTSMPERFAKQVAFLNTHPEVGICGAWQHHYGKGTTWDHKAEPDPEVQRCRLLFWCDLCHSTLMLRRKAFIDNNLFYDSRAKAEDFELWTRAMDYMQIANIPEVLGDYKEGTGITSRKVQALAVESGQITARTVQRVLGICIPTYDCMLLNGWINPLQRSSNRELDLQRLREILTQIWEKNEQIGFFDKKILLQVLAAKWQWTKNNVDWKKSCAGVKNIEQVFSDEYKPTFTERYENFKRNNPTFGSCVKRAVKLVFRAPVHLVRRIIRGLMKDVIDELSADIEGWTWDRYRRTEKDIANWTWDRFQKTCELVSVDRHVPFYGHEKIRVVFLFQVASFWPAQESVYRELKDNDDRFDVRLVCYDEDFDPTIKTETAREFLERENYDFEPWETFDMRDFNPHVVFVPSCCIRSDSI